MPKSKTKTMPLIETAHPGAIECRLLPDSLDAEARTAEVVWTTGARVLRKSWDGDYVEELEVTPKAVRLERLNGGRAPLLWGHRTEDDSQIGVVVSARVKNGAGHAVVRFGSHTEKAREVFEGVREGVLGNVSVGYIVHKTEELAASEESPAIRRAVDWEPLELSIVAISADMGAGIRSWSEAPNDCEVIHRAEGPDMERKMKQTATPKNKKAQPEAAVVATITPEQRQADRAAIRHTCRTLGLDADFSDKLTDQVADGELSLEEARDRAIDRRAETAPSNRIQSHVRMDPNGSSYDDPAAHREWMAEAIHARVNPRHQLSEPARQYAGARLSDLAAACLELRGERASMLSRTQIVERALGGLHGTSDFPLILGNALNKSLRMGYDAAPSGVRAVARQTTAADFRAKHRLMLGEAPTLEKTDEHGEFKSGTMAEADETYAIDTFGKIIGISRQAVVNDDLSAFDNLSVRMGGAAAEFEAQFLVDLVFGAAGVGPTMSDTKALFHTDHGNLAGSGAAPAEATLAAARLAMRSQTGLSGRKINVTPKYLLVPAALETVAEKLLATLRPTTVEEVNPFSGKLELIVDSRLDGHDAARWYVVADPAAIDGLEYAFLEGEEGPQVFMREGWRVDGVEWKVRLDFGAGFVDWRSWFCNPGD